MERLTVNDLHKVCYDPWELCGMDKYCTKGTHEEGGCAKGCHIIKMYKKLAEYEDAEEQGLLLRLPVSIGDTVWTPLSMSGWYLRKKDAPYQAKIVFIGVNDSEEMGGGLFNVRYERGGYMMQFDFSHIGKLVFLTKEEAEQALQKEGNNG